MLALYKLHIDDLAERVRLEEDLWGGDDNFVRGRCGGPSEDPAGLKRFFTYCEWWAEERGQVWAVQKCSVLSKNESHTQPYILAGRPIRERTEEDYLGVVVRPGELTRAGKRRRLNGAERRLGQLRSMFRSSKLSILMDLRLVESQVIPRYAYALHVVRYEVNLEKDIEELLDKSSKRVSRATTKKMVKRAQAALRIERGRVRRWKAAIGLARRLEVAVKRSESSTREFELAREVAEMFLSRHPGLHAKNLEEEERVSWRNEELSVRIRRQQAVIEGTVSPWLSLSTLTYVTLA